ncbi:uncharacterized protein RJT20DRAFT_127908 [Scheffersomyces xylosifermentans]|uniref:uncharacterized protein n=1 Tax=Scheffersomyces xylosifermentans TaxID=1304137 RepID=UPI00315D49DF
MYRYIARSTLLRQSAQRASQRLYSSSQQSSARGFRSVSSKGMFAAAGLVPVLAYGYLNSTNNNSIYNEIDQEKIKKDVKKAASNATEKVSQGIETAKAEIKSEVDSVFGGDAAEETKSEAIEEGIVSETAPGEEEEADPHAGAAYNPETGEINWDCPCLGGMADGPCGEEFKEAFACFVYSETEPKGIDCIKKFEAMRSCFKRFPEHYKEELYEDSDELPSADDAQEAAVVNEEVESTKVDLPVTEGKEI